LYTPQEVARFLRLRVQTVYDYIHRGLLPAVRLGNRYRIDPADLQAFLNLQRSGGPPAPIPADNMALVDAAPAE
jgi:excisionase family DNA binding protein